jgi:signal transduction histidine kinase
VQRLTTAIPDPTASPCLQDLVLANEMRTEVKGSAVGWLALTSGTIFLAVTFAGRAEQPGYSLWLGGMSLFLGTWLVSWIFATIRPPSDQAILTRWIPIAKGGMTFCNLVTAGGVWVFMPTADAELRALLLVLYAWFLIIQFAGATEATQVLRTAVALVLGSLTAWLLIARPPHFLVLSLFLPMFGATLIAIRRFVRQAVVAATSARAAAEAAQRDLALALTDLERERDAKTHFIRAASHDLQQPLQAAALFLGQVRSRTRAGPGDQAVDRLGQALGAARSLVTTMLDHLKLEGGAVRPAMTCIRIGEVFDRVLLTQQAAADAAGVRLRVAGRNNLVLADPALLARALENLVVNALRHAGATRLLLGARARGETVTIWVIDNGRGLAPGDEARIFSPFEQGSHVGPAGGFGLGLASTQGLVALMNGECGVRSQRDRGAAFYIRLGTCGEVPLSCAA